MKKKSFFISAFFIFTASVFGNSHLNDQSPPQEDGDGPKVCRCRDSGCKAGNSISFRRVCDENGGSNCASHDPLC